MKKLLLLALTVFLLTMFATTALADIGNPNGTRKNISQEGDVIDSPAYIVNAQNALGDNYLNVYGFKFTCLNKAALFFSCSVVRAEDPFPYQTTIGIFTNNEIIKTTLEGMGVITDQWVIVPIPGGSADSFTLMQSTPIFTSANSGRLLFTEDTAFATGGGNVDLSNFVWLGQDGTPLSPSPDAGSVRTADDMNIALWATLGAVSLTGCALLLISFRKKEANA